MIKVTENQNNKPCPNHDNMHNGQNTLNIILIEKF
jgi:hypothetical protein